MPFYSSIAGRYNFQTTALLRRDYLREFKNWVFACVTARSEEVGNIELKLLVNGKEVDTHPVLDLLNKVNPSMTKHELFYATQAFKDLDGNAFWYLARDNNGAGKILEIYPLRPDRVQIVPSKVNPLEVEGYIFVQPDGQRVPFTPEQILHHKNFNPLGGHPFPHRGMGIVEAAAWSVDTDNEARAYNYNFFKNSARPDGLLTTSGDAAMDSAEFKRLKEEWNAEHQGSDNASKVAVLGGGLTWTEIERSQNDMQFVQQRTMSRDEILSMFRVPKSIVGITDDVNRSNAEAAIYVFALRTIQPLMQQLVDTLNEFLLPEFGDNLELSFVSPVVEDRKKDIDEYTAALPTGASWLTINEVRERENLPRVEGGDLLYIPISVVPAGEYVEPVAPAKAAEEPVAKAPTEAEKSLEKFIATKKHQGKMPEPKDKPAALKANLTPEAKAQFIEIWKRNLQISAAPVTAKLHDYFTAQEKEVQKRAASLMKVLSGAQLKGAEDFLFDEDNAITVGISLITPFIKDYIKRSGGAAAALVGLADFNDETDTLQKFIAARSKYFAETVTDTTKTALLTSIKQGLDAGEGLGGIQDRIAGVYDIAKGSRTAMIARTEISAASNIGSINAYQQGGVTKIQWAVVDPKDEDCLENDGDVEVIGDAFPSGDTEPPVHPNCECTTIPVFD